MSADAVPTSDALAGTSAAETASGASKPQMLARAAFRAAAARNARLANSGHLEVIGLEVIGRPVGLTC
jgi:hypothetical protein